MVQPATVVVKIDDAQFRRGLDGITRSFANTANRLKSIGRDLLGVGLAAGAPLGLSAQAFATVDDRLRTIKAITGGTAEDMERLRAASKAFEKTAPADVASEMQFLAQAGYSAAEAIKAVPDALALIRLDPKLSGGRAAEIIGDIAKPFQLGIEQTQRIADVVAVTASKSTTDVEQIGIAMGYAASQAKAANVTLEETGALFAVLSNAGIKGSRAGTGLARMLRIISSEAGQRKLSDVLDIETVDKATGDLRNVADIFKEINDATKGLGSGDKLGVFNKIFGATGAEPALVLAQMADQIGPLVGEMSKVEGQARAMAKEIDAGAGGAMRSMTKDVASLGESVGKQLAPVLIGLSERFKVVAKSAEGVIEANPQIVQGAAAVSAIATALGTSLVSVGLGFQAAAVAANGFGKAQAFAAAMSRRMAIAHLAEAAAASANAAAHVALAVAKAAANPAALAALAGVAGSIVAITTAFVGLGAAVTAANFIPEFSRQSGTMQVILQGISRLLNAAKIGFKVLSASAVGAFKRISAVGRNALGILSNILDPRQLIKGIAAFARKAIEPFRDVFRGIATVLGPLAVDAFQSVEGAVRLAFGTMVEVAADALSYIAKLFQPLITTITGAARIAAGPFVAAFRIMGREVSAVVGGSISFLSGLATTGTKIAADLGAAFANIFRNISPAISLATEALRSGEFQKAFEIIALTAKYAFERAFVDIQIAWLKTVEYFASSFDTAIQSIISRMGQAAVEMGKAFAPIVGVLASMENRLKRASRSQLNKQWEGSVEDDQAAGIKAMQEFQKTAESWGEPFRQAQEGVKRAASETDSQLAKQLAMLEKTGRVMDEAFKGALGIFRNGNLLDSFGGAFTRIGQRFAGTTIDAFSPLGDFFKDLGGDVFAAAAGALADTERTFQSQVFGGASKQLIGQNLDAVGNQQLDVAREQLKEQRKTREAVEDLELGFG